MNKTEARLHQLFNELSVAVHQLDLPMGEGLDGRYLAARSSGATIDEALVEACTVYVDTYIDEDGMPVNVALAPVPGACVAARDALLEEISAYKRLTSEIQDAENKAGWSASP